MASRRIPTTRSVLRVWSGGHLCSHISYSYVACVTTVTTYLRTERPHLICSTVSCIHYYVCSIYSYAVCCLWCQVEAVQQYNNMLPPSSPKVGFFWLYLQRAFMRCIRLCSLYTAFFTQLCPVLYLYTSIKCPHSAMHFQKCQFCHCMQWQMNNGTRKALNFKWSSFEVGTTNCHRWWLMMKMLCNMYEYIWTLQ